MKELKKRDEKAIAKERRKKNLNNARARKSRLKKKKFYEELEIKCGELENQIKEKDEIISELRKALQQKETENVHIMNDNVQTNNETLITDCDNLLLNLSNNKEFRAKEREIAELFAPYGPERVKIINTAFSTLVENLYPEEFKILFKNISMQSNKRVKRGENEEGDSKSLFKLLNYHMFYLRNIFLHYATLKIL